MRSSIGSGSSVERGASGGSSSSSSPPSSLWLFGRATPSTRTVGRTRSAADREPTSGSPARKRSSRSPAAPLGTRARSVKATRPRQVRGDEREQQDRDSDADERVGEVEGGPPPQIE